MSNNTFVIRRTSDDLQHRSHKYIKREKVNGKWRYYYNIGQDEYAAMKKAEARMFKSTGTDPDRWRDPHDHSRSIQTDWQEAHAKVAKKAAETNNVETIDDLKYFRQETKKMIKPRRAYEAARRKYEKTPLYKLKQVANNGKKILDKLLGIR